MKIASSAFLSERLDWFYAEYLTAATSAVALVFAASFTAWKPPSTKVEFWHFQNVKRPCCLALRHKTQIRSLMYKPWSKNTFHTNLVVFFSNTTLNALVFVLNYDVQRKLIFSQKLAVRQFGLWLHPCQRCSNVAKVHCIPIGQNPLSASYNCHVMYWHKK